jgi:hypothetical protein
VKRVIAQSFTGWPNARDGGRVKTEADPLDPNPPRTMARTLDAIRDRDRRTIAVQFLARLGSSAAFT